MGHTFHKDKTLLTVKPEGRLDTATSPELENQLIPMLTDVTDLVIDLEKVDYVSSRGLRMFLTLEQNMEEKNGNMKVIHVNEYIKEIFDMTGFLDILTIE